MLSIDFVMLHMTKDSNLGIYTRCHVTHDRIGTTFWKCHVTHDSGHLKALSSSSLFHAYTFKQWLVCRLRLEEQSDIHCFSSSFQRRKGCRCGCYGPPMAARADVRHPWENLQNFLPTPIQFCSYPTTIRHSNYLICWGSNTPCSLQTL